VPWRAAIEQRRADKAADELREIAGLLEKIGVSDDAAAHPEMATITRSLAAIRRSLQSTVKRGRMTAAERGRISAGFTNIGEALRGK
jgi:hypothetical protein